MLNNLLTDTWIRGAGAKGDSITIAPHEIHRARDLVSFRPDFTGAQYQLLIALLQTALCPQDSTEWRERLDTPPSTEELEKCFSDLRPAFDLRGDGPRFMQDFELPASEEAAIAHLLIETPGENALRKSTDHFVKSGEIQGMCCSCAAIALFTLQLNAPAGGAGNRTSLRGGGPLTTLVVDSDLWRTLWRNVIPLTHLRALGNPDLPVNGPSVFPWLGPTVTSEPKTGKNTTPDQCHPLHVFWAMPRRIRLILDDVREGICDVCGARDEPVITGYRTKNYGYNYKGPWKHPLSPYGDDKDGEPYCLRPNPGGITYRHWLGLVVSDAESRSKRQPAMVVRYQTEVSDWSDDPLRIWAFGYDMDKMKARCWYDSEMPLIRAPDEHTQTFEEWSRQYVRAASEVAGNLRSAVRDAWFSPGAKVRGDLTFLDAELWQRTETPFYESLRNLVERLPEGIDAILDVSRAWLRTLSTTAVELFDEYAARVPIGAANPRRIAKARHKLQAFNNSKRIRNTILGLPEPTKPTKKTAAKNKEVNDV
ncbi:MAG: type I-E CRISPR-associated protein Cse1/CasA [Chitinivibrionales bacterium]|nr:type I-E CRISPR-associated protein Cse1/CasA [Chitinivibrionales bacterium]